MGYPSKKRPHTSHITPAFLSLESGLKQYLMRFFVRHQDIEDVVQETFIRAWESEKNQEINSPKSYLFKVAKNLALSELQKKSNQLMSYMGDLDGLDVIDNTLSIEEALEIQQQLLAFSEAASALPPQCQRVLLMRKVFGFSHKEIARRLNISPRTVEKHLTKGLQRCQDSLEEFLNAESEVLPEVKKAGGKQADT